MIGGFGPGYGPLGRPRRQFQVTAVSSEQILKML